MPPARAEGAGRTIPPCNNAKAVPVDEVGGQKKKRKEGREVEAKVADERGEGEGERT